MVDNAEYHTLQTAQHDAKAILTDHGYDVASVRARSGRNVGKISLIAWNQSGPLFLCIRSYRSRFHQHEDIAVLSALQRSGRYPGDIQYWVRNTSGWSRFRIYTGGAVQLGSMNDQ